MIPRLLQTVLLALLAFGAMPLRADQEDSPDIPGEFSPPTPWAEADFVLPPVPGDGDWVRLSARPGGAVMDMALVPDSIEVGADGVVRYVLALESPSGARNVFFEGIRCDSGEWRSYAYLARGRWQSLGETAWSTLHDWGTDAYRYLLYRNYFCRLEGEALPVTEIRRRIRHDDIPPEL